MSKAIGLYDKHHEMIHEGDIVNVYPEKFNRVVKYYDKYAAFSLDDERQDNSHYWFTGYGSWETFDDNKYAKPDVEIRSKFVGTP